MNRTVYLPDEVFFDLQELSTREKSFNSLVIEACRLFLKNKASVKPVEEIKPIAKGSEPIKKEKNASKPEKLEGFETKTGVDGRIRYKDEFGRWLLAEELGQ